MAVIRKPGYGGRSTIRGNRITQVGGLTRGNPATGYPRLPVKGPLKAGARDSMGGFYRTYGVSQMSDRGKKKK